MTIARHLVIGFTLLSAFVLSISAAVSYFIFVGNNLWSAVLYLHIVTAAMAILIGPFQLFPRFRIGREALHRTLNKLYAMSILFSGVAGIYLSVYAFGGILAKMGLLILSPAWLYTTYLAVEHARQGRVALRQQWMCRSYVLTFTAVTFGIWSAV